MTSTLDIDRLYDLALDRLHDLIPFAGAVIGVRTAAGWIQAAARRPAEIGQGEIVRLRGWATSSWVTDLGKGVGFYLGDIRGDDPRAVEYRKYLPMPIDESPMRYFRSIMEVPLMLNDEVVGEISVSHEEPNYFSDAHFELVNAVGSYLVIAMENARLYAEADNRARDLSTLLELSKSVTSTLDLEQLYEAGLSRLRDLIPYTGASIAISSPQGRRQVAARRPAEVGNEQVVRLPGWEESDLLQTIASGETVIIADIRGDSEHAREYRAFIPVPIEESALRYFRSAIAHPLVANGKAVGDLWVVHEDAGYFSAGHVNLVASVANHIAIGIENARLYAEAENRAKELASLLQVSRSVAGSHETEDLARLVLDEFRNVMEYGNASLVLHEGPLLRVAYANTHADPSPRREVIGVAFEVANAGPIWEQLGRGDPLLVDDNRDGGYWSLAYQKVVGELYETAFANVRSWLGVPLRVRNETIGFLTISAPRPRQFTQAHVDFAMAFAAQVSVAFENAELLRQAQSVAATAERQRLARELHDSVSQALYGIALGARTARTQLDRNPAGAVEPIEYVLSLAEAGLAEMRALIFELRPESLANEGLVAALEKQVAATRARYGLQVGYEYGDEPVLPIPAKEAFYRIAQEALHNVVKHARATAVRVTLESAPGRTLLTVSDDGVGFDPEGEFPGHLGLQSMRERAGTVGAVIDVSSSTGKGTTVRLSLPTGG
jgi:signal transduction histidine kinase